MLATVPPDPLIDGHVHTLYSDGSASPEQVVRAAIDQGLSALAITDHMPLPEPRRYAMAAERLAAYRRELDALRAGYRGRIRIQRGLEMEYCPAEDHWCREIAAMGWDWLVGSVHRLACGGGDFLVNGSRPEFDQALQEGFGGSVQRLVEAYYDALRCLVDTGLCHVVGHLDVVKKHLSDRDDFDERQPWYRRTVTATLEAVSASGMAVEINVSGLFQPPVAPYPSLWIIDACRQQGIPLIFGSDAHRPDRVGVGFRRALRPVTDAAPDRARQPDTRFSTGG